VVLPPQQRRRPPPYTGKVLKEKADSWHHGVSPSSHQAQLDSLLAALKHLADAGLGAASVLANLLLTPKFGKESDLWVQLGEKSVRRKEGFFRRIRQKNPRSAICFRSARKLLS
jgi:hypothetical protein